MKMQSNLNDIRDLSMDKTVDLIGARFNASLPYTAANDSSKIVIAVNPLRQIPGVNGQEAWSKSDNRLTGRSSETTEPHVYDISAGAIHRMQTLGRNTQTIIVSGESGAGKTVHTTILLEHIARKSGAGKPGLINRTLASNPVMEAFGNASTAANENSSRFGKMLVLGFDNDGGLQSTRVNPFLFERTRVMNKPATERNFHIFYQFLAGIASYGPRLKAALGVLHENLPEHFSILQHHLLTEEDTWHRDRLEAARTLRALSCLGVSQPERMNLMYSLAGILHLGNIRFVDVEDQGRTRAEINQETRGSATQAARLLGMSSVEDLEAALLERIVTVRGEQIKMSNTAAQAEQARDSLGRELYSRMFRWLTAFINQDQEDPQQNMTNNRTNKCISLLDVMGFEVQEKNSLEQLLINYCNEKLQYEFSRTMILQVQEEYKMEGVLPDHLTIIEPPRSTLKVFEDGPKGLWALLDQECFVPGGSEAGFVRKVGRAHHPTAVETGKLLSAESFVIHHYAGRVEYTAQNIMEKSSTSQSKAVIQLLDEKSNAGRFFSLAGEDTASSSSSSVQRTVGMRFKNELEGLLSELSGADDVAWVRCIRPNNTKNPLEFNREMVVRQIQASGVVPAVQLARTAFPHSIKLSEWQSTYATLLDKAMTVHGLNIHNSTTISVGKTRVYVSGEAMVVLNQCLDEHRKQQAVVRMQSQFRGWRHRKSFRTLLKVVKSMQSRLRFRRYLSSVRHQRAAAKQMNRMVVVIEDQLLDESHLQDQPPQEDHQMADVSSLSESTISTLEGDHEMMASTSVIFTSDENSVVENYRPRNVVDEKDLNYEQLLLDSAKRMETLEKKASDQARMLAELEKEVQRLRIAGVDSETTKRVGAFVCDLLRIEREILFKTPVLPWKHVGFTHWSNQSPAHRDLIMSITSQPTRLFKRKVFTTGGCLVLLGSEPQMRWHAQDMDTFDRLEHVCDWVLENIESDWSDSE